MFQFQPIHAGGIGLFDIVVVIVIIELIDDADAERVGVGKAAIVDAGYIEVFGISEVAFGLENGIYLDEPFADEIPMAHVIKGGLPQRILLVFIFQWDGIGDMLMKIAIGYGQANFAAVVCQVMAQGFGDWKDGLFPGGFVGLAGRKRKRIDELHAKGVFD